MGLNNDLNYSNNLLTNRSTYGEIVLEAYKRLTGHSVDRTSARSITVNNKYGTIIGVVLFTDITISSAAIHIHLPKLLTRKIIKEALNYAFTTIGIKKLYAEIRSDNKSMLDIAKKLGFIQVASLPDRYDMGVDQIIMLASESDVTKWIR